MNSERDAILAHVNGPLRILAGAGAGKTRVIVDKLVGLIREDAAEPGQILALTFTNKAAEEMSDRVHAALAKDPVVAARSDLDELSVQTFHAFAAGLLREFGIRIGVEADVQVISRAKTWQMMLTVLDEVTFDHLRIPPTRIGPNFIDLFVQLSNGLADHIRTVEDFERHVIETLDRSDAGENYKETLRQGLEVVPVLKAYQARKTRHNLIDYADQIALVVRMLEQHDAVRTALQAQYRYILVDEYQDTNVAQRKLLQMLALDETTGRARNITVVGDNDQSIYAFRGATVENILHFEDDFPGAASLPLSVNYRSGPEILACAEAVISKIPEERRPPKPYSAKPDAPTSQVEYFVAATAESEAQHIARMIVEAKPWADALNDHSKRGWRAFGVLGATNKDLVPVADALRNAGIPIEHLGGGGFFARPEIVDILAILRAAADPSDNISLMRILKGPRYRVGNRDLVWVARASSSIGKNRAEEIGLSWEDDHGYRLIDGIELIGAAGASESPIRNLTASAATRLIRFREELRELIKLAARTPLVDFVAHVIDWSGLLTECAASAKPEAREAERSIAQLRDYAQAFQPLDGSSTLRSFLEFLEFAEDTDEEAGVTPSADDAVRLVTIHRAKGLEFPCVFLCAVAGEWPMLARAKDETTAWQHVPHALRGDREHIPVWDGDDSAFHEQLLQYEREEQRRIAYVGITRAMSRLVASRAHFYRENKRPTKEAPFWRDVVDTRIPKTLFEEPCPERNPSTTVEEPIPVDPPSVERDSLSRLIDPEFALLDELAPHEAADVQARADALRAELAALAELEATARATASATRAPEDPTDISVSALLDRIADPVLFHERHVLGLPEPVSWRARRGTAVHEWIEERSWSASAAAGLPDVPGAGPESLLPEDIHLDVHEFAPDEGDDDGDGDRTQVLIANFLQTPYASMTPKYVEWPFTLRLNGLTVRGRIDAIYEREDGTLEIVDWKTGSIDPDSKQLAVYELAVKEILKPPAVRSFFVGLADGSIVANTQALDSVDFS